MVGRNLACPGFLIFIFILLSFDCVCK
jgi:hypothetical protein